jgi:TRAP-type mannitol/chloroaromatic compound transport system permease large subunit
MAVNQVLDLFVQRTYGVMSNDVLIAIPLFLFMGYLVERAQLIDRCSTAAPRDLAGAGLARGGDHRHLRVFATATESSARW